MGTKNKSKMSGSLLALWSVCFLTLLTPGNSASLGTRAAASDDVMELKKIYQGKISSWVTASHADGKVTLEGICAVEGKIRCSKDVMELLKKKIFKNADEDGKISKEE